MNSGNWIRLYSKQTAESKIAISIGYLKKQGLLQAGRRGSLSWSFDGVSSASVGYWVKADGLQLDYSYQESTQVEATNVALLLRFAYTPCHYGGQRTWLVCPECQQRVGVVYSVGKYFRCRCCCGLNYHSQHLNYYDRQRLNLQAMRKKLGGDALIQVFPDKPKGMHWKTYLRFVAKAKQYESEVLEGDWILLKRVEKLLDKITVHSNKQR